METYKYDNNGNVIEKKTRSGAFINSTYDNLDRLIAKTYPSEPSNNITYSYDLLNRRIQSKLNNGTNTVDYAYDNAGRLRSTSSGGKTLSYEYDAAGNRTKTTWPDNTFSVTTSYDALNRPSVIKENGTTNLATYAYDDLSRRTKITLGNGTTTTSTYNAQNQLSGLSHKLSSVAQDVSYTYTRNRIGDLTNESWSNDLYQWTLPAASTVNYTANGLNQYTTVKGLSQTYDANGNLTADGTGWRYGYDLNNRLKSAVKTGAGAVTANLNYDAEGRLNQTVVGSTTTDLLYDGTDLVAEYNGANLARRYVHGPGVDEPLVWYEGNGTGAKNWIYTNHLGSVVALANANGTSTASYSYGPFGEPSSSTGNMRFRYTGQQLIPALNLYYYKARFYSPTLGRFLQTDPIGQQDDMNVYAYVGNNSINYADPTGMFDAKMLMELDYAKPSFSYDNLMAGGKRGRFEAYAEAVDTFISIVQDGKTFRQPSEPGEKSYQTYQKVNPETKEVYTGKTSGTGTPIQNVINRDRNHHMNSQGFGPAKLLDSAKSPEPIRGLEQLRTDGNGGAKSQGGTSGNKINPISLNNPKGASYLNSAIEFFKFRRK